MDHKMVLTKPVAEWFDFRKEQLLFPSRQWFEVPYSEEHLPIEVTVMYSPSPRHPAFASIARRLVSSVANRYYGRTMMATVSESFLRGLMDEANKNATFFRGVHRDLHVKWDKGELFGWRYTYSLKLSDSTEQDNAVIIMADSMHSGKGAAGYYHPGALKYTWLWATRQAFCDKPIRYEPTMMNISTPHAVYLKFPFCRLCRFPLVDSFVCDTSAVIGHICDLCEGSPAMYRSGEKHAETRKLHLLSGKSIHDPCELE